MVLISGVIEVGVPGKADFVHFAAGVSFRTMSRPGRFGPEPLFANGTFRFVTGANGIRVLVVTFGVVAAHVLDQRR